MLNLTIYNNFINENTIPQIEDMDISSLYDGGYLFSSYSTTHGKLNISNLNIDLSKLVSGHSMFSYNVSLITVNSNLDSLINGQYMFSGCANLKTFHGKLNSLTNADSMFSGCSSLTNFDSDLSNLINGQWMFYYCTGLHRFEKDLSKVIDGANMFGGCSNLDTFTSDISSLIKAKSMFNGCILNPASIEFIANGIRDIKSELINIDNYVDYDDETNSYTRNEGWLRDGTYLYTLYEDSSNINFLGRHESYKLEFAKKIIPLIDIAYISIGINVSEEEIDGKSIDQQLLEFAQEAGYSSWDNLNQHFIDKGWIVAWQYNKIPDTITYTRRAIKNTKPIYVRLIEEQNIADAAYHSEDKTKYYSMEWGHYVTHPEKFQVFNSLNEACEFYKIISKETQNEFNH